MFLGTWKQNHLQQKKIYKSERTRTVKVVVGKKKSELCAQIPDPKQECSFRPNSAELFEAICKDNKAL